LKPGLTRQEKNWVFEMPDFFVVSKVAPLLLYPLPASLLLIFVLSWWSKNSSVRWCIQLLVILLWVLSTPWFADRVSHWWETPRSVRSQLPAVSDAAVVLGGLSDPTVSTAEHLEFNRAAERITEAVSLWREGRVRALLITSGSGELLDPKAAEAPGLAAWAHSQGVPTDAVVVESASRNTHENAVLSLPLAESRGFRHFVLVTSAVHMRRAEAVFRKAGYASGGRTLSLWSVDTQINTIRFPFDLVPDPNCLATVQTVIREVVGYAVYFFQGYL
jgi:uncharacterized SAM-binding protein YcdF (DUF218 family)